MRVLRFIPIGLVAIFAMAVLFLIIGIPSDFLVENIRSRFAAETGYQLEIVGGAKLSIWPSPSVIVRDITLVNPDDLATQTQLTVGSVRVEIAASSLFSGQPKITEFALIRPKLRVPLLRRATEAKAAPDAKPAASPAPKRRAPYIGRIVVEDGSVVFVRSDNQVENQIDHVNITATLPDYRLDAKISAKAGAQTLRIAIKSKTPIDQTDKPLPLELTIEAPGMLDGALNSTANVTSIGRLVKINDLEGLIGKDRFTGWASVDLTSKPKVKVDLDFKRLSLAAVAPQPDDTTAPSTIGEPWSAQKINLNGLNFVDAQVALSAAEFQAAKLRLAPVYVEAALLNGVLDVALSNTGIYGGKGDGLLALDVSGELPRQSMHLNLDGVRALPLLSTLADFRELDGIMTGKIDVRAGGENQRAIMSSLAGTVDVLFQDGEIRSVNIAQMVRNLTQSTLNGWQENKKEKTDLTQLRGLFKINAGIAKTDNLNLFGPLIRVNGAGTINLSAKTLQLKLDTKLVMTLEGQGGTASPIGFGVPVMVEGKWDAPKIYPDMVGIFDNPDAAYAKLHELGLGLFGDKAGKLGDGDNSFLKGLGTLLNNKGSDSKDSQAPAPSGKQVQPQDSKAKDSQLQNAQPKEPSTMNVQPNDSQSQDAKPKDTDAQDTKTTINEILKNIFGK
jgi:AsmA protein